MCLVYYVYILSKNIDIRAITRPTEVDVELGVPILKRGTASQDLLTDP